MSGRFIVFEGITGSGKKLLSNLLAERFRNNGFNVIVINFPNFESEIARLTKRNFDPYTQALIYAADRSNSQIKIKEVLEKGEIVISDRYSYSNFAYQHAQGIPLEWLMEIEKNNIKPDLAILVDVPVETGIKRVQQASLEDFTRRELAERLQREKDYIQKVRDTYLHIASSDKETKWLVVDGTDITFTQDEIWELVKKELNI